MNAAFICRMIGQPSLFKRSILGIATVFSVLAATFLGADGFAADFCRYNAASQIVHLPQSHWRPEFAGNSEAIERIARAQFEIAQTILGEPSRTVFDESNVAVFGEGVLSSLSSAFAGWTLRWWTFPNGVLPSNFSDMNASQKTLLAKFGATALLYFMGRIASVGHVYESVAQAKAISAQIEVLAKPFGGISAPAAWKDPAFRKAVFVAREQMAMVMVAHDLEINPSEKIFIVYGSDHDFSPYMTGSFERATCPHNGFEIRNQFIKNQ